MKKEEFFNNNLSEPITDTTHVYIQKSNGLFPVSSTESKGETSHTSLPCFCCLQDRSGRAGEEKCVLNEGQKLQLNKHEPHSPCIDALSFVLIFSHISATISEEAPCRMEFSCPPGIIENYRENT